MKFILMIDIPFQDVKLIKLQGKFIYSRKIPISFVKAPQKLCTNDDIDSHHPSVQ